MADKVAFVLGGSGEIGEAIVYNLAKSGIQIAIGYYVNSKKAHEIAERCIKDYSVKASAVHVDVTLNHSVDMAYHRIVDELGRHPLFLIYAAGIAQASLFQEYTEADMDKMIDVHVKGALHVIQAGLPFLLQQKQGRIVCVSSVLGSYGGSYEVVYSTVKGAQNSLVKSLAKELAPSNITVNAVAPGAINTKMVTDQLSKEDLDVLTCQIPMCRLGESEEVASLVDYLCTEEARYLTGQIIHVNGGWNG